MTNEQIEKAAKEYRMSLPYCDDPKVRGMSLGGYNGFIKGADWRINSVWHDMKSEEPQVYGEYENRIYPQIPCLVYGKLSTGIGYGVRYWNITEKCWDDEECDDYECSKDAIEEWAYLDDLLPDRKEDCK